MKTLLSRQYLGLSLIELLIVLALGMVLLLGAFEVFVRGTQTYRMQDVMVKMQENARSSFNRLFSDLRMSRFLGCKNLDEITPVNLTAIDYGLTKVVQSYHNSGDTWSPVPPVELTTASAASQIIPRADSDIITIMSADSCSTGLTTAMTSVDSSITVGADNSCGFTHDDIVIVSDCKTADIIRLNSSPVNGSVVHPALQKAYTSSAEMMKLKWLSYFVAVDPDSQMPGLYMFNHAAARSANNPVALFDGVENLQIRYGVDASNNGVYDRSRNTQGDDWSGLDRVHITLLVRSAEKLTADAYTLNVGGSSKTYDDGVVRESFSAAVTLRNRG